MPWAATNPHDVVVGGSVAQLKTSARNVASLSPAAGITSTYNTLVLVSLVGVLFA